MGKKTLSSTLGRPTTTLTEYLRKFGLQYADLDAMIISYPEAFDHCYNRLLQLVYNLVIIDGEPESVDDTFLKFCIFVNGRATFFKTDAADEGVLRALNGVPADVPDVYYMPEDMIVDNPTFSKTYELKRGEDCEVVYCRQIDRYSGGAGSGGLGSLIRITAQLLADNIISLNVAQKNTRATVALTADDEATKRSAEEAMRSMYAGEPFKVVMGNLVGNLSGVPVNITTANRYIVDLISAQQYILAHFFEQIGLQTHDQLKKERLITDEINDNADMALYNIYSIIESIQEGLDRVNKMFGTDMHVYLNPLIAKQLEQSAAPAEDPKPEEGEENAQEEENSSSGADGGVGPDPDAGGLPADNPGAEILLDAVGERNDIEDDGARSATDGESREDNQEESVGDSGRQSDIMGEDETARSDEDASADQSGGDAAPDESSSSEEPGEDEEPQEDNQQPGEEPGVSTEINITADDTPAENEPAEPAEETPAEEPAPEEAPTVEINITIEGGDPDGPDREESPDAVE